MTPNGLGNKCGHNKNAPARYQHPRLTKRPKLIQQAKYRLYSINDTARGYRSYFKALKNYRFTELKTARKTRSESREAFALMCSSIFDHLDLETMALGRWMPNGEFQSFSYDDIYQTMREALPEHIDYSERRFWRHIRLLKGSGYLRSRRRRYNTGQVDSDGNPIIREDVSVKFVTRRLLTDLGFSEDQVKEARSISKKRNAKIRVHAPQSQITDAVLNTPGIARKWFADQRKSAKTKLLNSRAAWNQAFHELLASGLSLDTIKAKLGPCPS